MKLKTKYELNTMHGPSDAKIDSMFIRLSNKMFVKIVSFVHHSDGWENCAIFFVYLLIYSLFAIAFICGRTRCVCAVRH